VGDTFLIHGGRLESLKGLGDVKEAITIKGENYYNRLSLEGISECKWLNMGEFFNIPYDTKHCLLVLENGCLANNWTVNGPVMGKDIHATRSNDNIARSIILTSPKLQEASLLKYFDENPMSIDLLDSTSERTKGIKNFIFSKLGYTDEDIAAVKRQKNRIL
jgi:hypothetical protein